MTGSCRRADPFGVSNFAVRNLTPFWRGVMTSAPTGDCSSPLRVRSGGDTAHAPLGSCVLTTGLSLAQSGMLARRRTSPGYRRRYPPRVDNLVAKPRVGDHNPPGTTIGGCHERSWEHTCGDGHAPAAAPVYRKKLQQLWRDRECPGQLPALWDGSRPGPTRHRGD
jgi:hypothetical protein